MSKGSAPKQLANLSHHKYSERAAMGLKKMQGEAVSFDVSTMTPPTRTYSAEVAFIQFIDDEVYFVFAQRTLIGDALETAISLRMHGFYARQFLKSVEAMNAPSLYDIAANLNISAHPTQKVTQNPPHFAKLSANIVQVSISGFDTCCDFFQFSPTTVTRKNNKSDVKLDPIARVDLRTSLFLGIYQSLKEIETSFPQVDGGGAQFINGDENERV